MSFLYDVAVLFVIVFLNSFFVIAEIAIIASRKSKLEGMSKNGDVGASKALELSSHPEKFLSTVQVGITFMSIMIGIYGGTSLADDVDVLLSSVPYIAPYSKEISYTLILIVVTYFTVLGEIIPKRIALFYPEVIASYISYIMLFFTKLCYPLVYTLTHSTHVVLQLFNVKIPDNKISIDELKSMMNQAEFTGILASTEQDMLKRVIHLSNTQIGAVMTPRNKMIYLDLREDKSVNIAKIQKHPFNYFPVIDGDFNNLIGIVPVKSLLNHTITNEQIKSIASLFPVIYTPEMARVSRLIDVFREKKVRIAIVLDEYGDIEGLVTLNDILKILVGELAIGMKDKMPEIVSNLDGSYTISGNSLIEEVMSLLNLTYLPGEDDEDYRTLASFVLRQIGHFPNIGENFTALGWNFKVLKMDKRRIERVLIRPMPEGES